MSAIQFIESDHSYRVDGQLTPSVTQVLKPLYGDLRFVDADLLQYKSELGQAVHKAVELHCKGSLDLSSVDDLIAPYLRQYQQFEMDSGFRFEASECRVSSRFGYAGTYDLKGWLNHRKALIDVKTVSALSKAVALQLAGYQQAEIETTGDKCRRYALRLTPDNYYLHPYSPNTDSTDLAAFLGLVKINQWCAANNKQLGEMYAA